MSKVQLIHTEGEDLVVLPRSEYDALLARLGDEAAEGRTAAAIAAGAAADLDAGREIALPDAVWARILDDGENPVKVLREHRNLTQAQLAERAGIAQPFISKLERGESAARMATWDAIADALAVPRNTLREMVAKD